MKSAKKIKKSAETSERCLTKLFASPLMSAHSCTGTLPKMVRNVEGWCCENVLIAWESKKLWSIIRLEMWKNEELSGMKGHWCDCELEKGPTVGTASDVQSSSSRCLPMTHFAKKKSTPFYEFKQSSWAEMKTSMWQQLGRHSRSHFRRRHCGESLIILSSQNIVSSCARCNTVQTGQCFFFKTVISLSSLNLNEYFSQ